MLSQLAVEAPPSSSASSKMAEIQQSYERLKALTDGRQSMLESFMPNVQQYNSSRGAWENLLCEWEEKAAAFPPPAATPGSIQEQISDMQVNGRCLVDSMI